MTEDNTFIPKDKPVIHLDKGKFIPFKQNISRDAKLGKPFITLTIEDSLPRRDNKDK